MGNIVHQYGLWCLLPPVVAIILAFLTKRVLPSLFIAILVGATIVSGGNLFKGFSLTVEKYIAGSIANPWNAGIIVFDIALGGTIGIVAKSGGAKAIADGLGRMARKAKSALAATWAMGLMIFFDDYSNTLLVGTTMRPLTDKHKVSREKLAFVTDSTAAPVASMAVIATWTAYELGLLKDAFASIGMEDANVYLNFLKSIPFRFYSILMLGFVLMIILTGRDYGPMLKAERRARKEGKLVRDGATPLASKELTEMKIKEGTPIRMINAILPILTIIIMVVVGLFINGRNAILSGDNATLIQQVKDTPFNFSVMIDILGNSNASVAMMWASFSGTIVAFILVLAQRILTFKETMEAWIDGAKSLVIAIMVLVLAWGIGSICKDLGTANYLSSILSDKVSPGIIPMAVFILSCIIAFSTGTSWGTTAIMMPIAVPLLFNISGGDTGLLLYATIGSVFTGAVFGDHCSPISDTTIMSSMSSACDHLDHVKTQMPYAVTVAGIALVLGYLPLLILPSNKVMSIVFPIVVLTVGFIAAYCIIKFVGKKVDDAPEVSPENVEQNV